MSINFVAVEGGAFVREGQEICVSGFEMSDAPVTQADLREESDGLSGELYTEDGWIAQFSGQRK